MKDVYFDYDKSDIRADQQSSLQADIAFLRRIPTSTSRSRDTATSADPPNTTWRWATAEPGSVQSALTQGGVTASNIKTISYGKEKPFCTESNEACWQQNRRGHFVYQK